MSSTLASVPAVESDRVPSHALGSLVRSNARPARLLRLLLISLGVVLGLASLQMPLSSLAPEPAYGKDLVQEYVLSKALLEGADPYRNYSSLVERYLGFNPNPAYPYATAHPPTAGLFFFPLAFVDYLTAAVAWFWVELACLAISIFLLARAAGGRFSLPSMLAVTVAALAWYPFSVDLYFGQLTLVQLALLSGAWYSLRAGRPILGGVLFGGAVLLKQFLWPLLLLLLLRQMWRPLVASLVTIATGYAIAIWAFGLESVLAYFTQVLPAVADGYKAFIGNISLSTLGWRLLDGTGSPTIPGQSAPPLLRSMLGARFLSAAAPAVVLILASVVARRHRSFDAALGVMVCASIVASPISWSHYLVLVCIPIAYVIGWLAQQGFPRRETNVFLIIGLLLFLPYSVWLLLAGSFVGSVIGQTEASPVALPLSLLVVAPSWLVCVLGWLTAALSRDTSRDLLSYAFSVRDSVATRAESLTQQTADATESSIAGTMKNRAL